MAQSFAKNIARLKRLTKTYHAMKYGAAIRKSSELLPLFKIKELNKKSHPHKNLKVCISRKSLKHFVEKRKEEFIKNNSEESLILTYFIIDNIQETIGNFDFYQPKTPFKYFYGKDYSLIGKHILRILLEVKENRLEIVSMHFRRKDIGIEKNR